MPWIKFDDAIADDSALMSAGAAGGGILLFALSYSNRNLTDGLVPRAFLLQRCGEGGTREALEAVIALLVKYRVVHEADQDGIPHFRIDERYLQHQPSAAEVRMQRATRSRQKARAGRLGGLRSGAARRKQEASNNTAPPAADAQRANSRTPAPSPVPDPQGEKSTGAIAPGPPSSRRPPDKDPVSHRWLMKRYDEIVAKHPDESIVDRTDRLKEAVSREGCCCEPLAIHKAVDAVEHVNSLRAVSVKPRGSGGFKQIASR